MLVNHQLFLLCALTVTACGGTSSPPGAAGAGGAPSTTPSSFAATYRVPVPPALSAAATFQLTEVDWRVATDGTARLAYTLPLGLVGLEIRVDFTGQFDAATGTGHLVGTAGSADCTLATAALSCSETMNGLLPLTPDLAVVESVASTEFAGPVQDRIDVAKLFSGDPIGVVSADVTTETEANSTGGQKTKNGK